MYLIIHDAWAKQIYQTEELSSELREHAKAGLLRIVEIDAHRDFIDGCLRWNTELEEWEDIIDGGEVTCMGAPT